MSEIHEILKLAAQVVLLRRGDVLTENGDLATTDVDAFIRLDYALAETFNLTSDNVTFENIDDLMDKINWMSSPAEQRITALEQQLKAAKKEAVWEAIESLPKYKPSWHQPFVIELKELEMYANNLEGK